MSAPLYMTNRWGTAANPERVPLPRTREEWADSRVRCGGHDAMSVELLLAHYRMTGLFLLGSGYEGSRSLSKYAAGQVAGLMELAVAEEAATAEDYADKVALVAGAHYRAHPVRHCAECGEDRPHTSGIVVTCLVCGDRP